MRIVAIAALLVPIVASADPCDSIPVWRDGHRDGEVCRADAEAQGLTVLDLGDDWVPRALAESEYRPTYLALAAERFDDAGHDGTLAVRDRYLEIFGIEPTLSVIRSRLADEKRHACHAAVDDDALIWGQPGLGEEDAGPALQRIMRAKLTGDTEARAYVARIRAIQAHLACDGLFIKTLPLRGGYTMSTLLAVAAFQRGVMLLPTGTFEDYTRVALTQNSRERDFIVALRVLRARVADATGLIEDGSAGGGQGTVFGRMLDPEPIWHARGHDALPDAAPDLVSAATEAAATALGWSDPASVLRFLDIVPEREVAVPLPPPPSYHGATMRLEVEIDRGDVWRDRDGDGAGGGRRPALILYARDGNRRIPLVRWPTTIGGWQPQLDGDVEVDMWKESPVGQVAWRDLYIVPRWKPPPSTPDRELVRQDGDRYVLAIELVGPSYRAAFGLVAFNHGGGDHIRTHGTANPVSLQYGDSHGCHRLLGVHALHLADFIFRHHRHVARGSPSTHYRRFVNYNGSFEIEVETLGEKIALVPPIPVTVLAGDVHE